MISGTSWPLNKGWRMSVELCQIIYLNRARWIGQRVCAYFILDTQDLVDLYRCLDNAVRTSGQRPRLDIW